jgi:precorrin-6B methylase 2
LFRSVRLSVHEASGGRQSPWVFDNLLGDVVLRERDAAPASSPEPLPPADAATLALRAELTLWESIKDGNSAELFEDYLKHYPSGRFRGPARERLRALESARENVERATGVAAGDKPVDVRPSLTRPSGERELLGYSPGDFPVGSAGKDVVYVPTPPVLAYEMLKLAEVGPADRVYDLGSGDGRIVIMAAKHFGARGVGVEYNAALNKQAVENARAAGVDELVTFRTEDLFKTDLSPATVITMFLLPSINEKLRPALERLAPGTRIVTNSFTIDGWEPVKVVTADNCTSWCTANLYVVPSR